MCAHRGRTHCCVLPHRTFQMALERGSVFKTVSHMYAVAALSARLYCRILRTGLEQSGNVLCTSLIRTILSTWGFVVHSAQSVRRTQTMTSVAACYSGDVTSGSGRRARGLPGANGASILISRHCSCITAHVACSRRHESVLLDRWRGSRRHISRRNRCR